MNLLIAYIDPAVMTAGIQALVGVVIAVGAVVALSYRKAKKKVMNKLNIDENSKKETEEEVTLIDEEK